MMEFIALIMAEFGVSLLVLTRDYAGGDEAKMLYRHLSQASVRIGVGANRGAIAASVLARYGHIDSSLTFHKLSRPLKSEPGQENENVGVVILDDGMQDIDLIRGRVEELRIWFQTKAIVVVTEKDYDCDPFILGKQGDLTILVLCSSIQFIPLDNHEEEDFIMKLNRLLIDKYEWHG